MQSLGYRLPMPSIPFMPPPDPIMGPIPSPCPIMPDPCSPLIVCIYWMTLQISVSVSCPLNPTMPVPADPFLITQKTSPSVR